VQIPAGTAGVVVAFGVGGGTENLPVGSTMTFSHLLLEIASPGQTQPSAWADLDVTGQVLDIFQSGSSSGLRVQGSVLPSFTGQFTYTSSDASVTLTWTGLVILWPDGAITQVQDGSMSFAGLTATTTYWAFLYFDVIYGGVALAVPASPVGTPAKLGAAYDANAAQVCKLDNHIALTPGGMQMTTAASGGTGGGTGGGGHTVGCTIRGTKLMTPDGPISNAELKERFDRGEDVFLLGRDGPERIRMAEWMEVPEYFGINVAGFRAFGCSGSHMVRTRSGYRWVQDVPDGTEIETTRGFGAMRKSRLSVANEVLRIELEGPSHEYQVGDGVWTHNMKVTNPPTLDAPPP